MAEVRSKIALEFHFVGPASKAIVSTAFELRMGQLAASENSEWLSTKITDKFVLIKK